MQTLTIHQAADRLSCSDETIIRLVVIGQLDVDGDGYVLANSVEAYLEEYNAD